MNFHCGTEGKYQNTLTRIPPTLVGDLLLLCDFLMEARDEYQLKINFIDGISKMKERRPGGTTIFINPWMIPSKYSRVVE